MANNEICPISEWDKKYSDACDDKRFIKWLDLYEPDWGLEYSGTIIGMHAAWLAAIENHLGS